MARERERKGKNKSDSVKRNGDTVMILAFTTK
jgi:hypothetical protein